MQGFYFLVEYGLVLIYIYILKVYLKKSCSILLRKKCSIHYLHFSFEKYAPSQVLKDSSVENVKTTPSTFLSKFSSEIYLSRIINYWGSVLHTSYLTWGALSLVCVLSVFFFFLSSFSFLFLPLTDTNDSQNNKNVEGIIIFLVFHFHLLTNIHLVHWDFYHFFLIDLFVITRLIADETCSP